MGSRPQRLYPDYATTFELGQLKGRMSSVEDDVKDIKSDIKDIKEDIIQNTTITNQIKTSLDNVIKGMADRAKIESEKKRSFSFWELTILTTIITAVVTAVVGLLFHYIM